MIWIQSIWMIYLGGLAFQDAEERKIPVLGLWMGAIFSGTVFLYGVLSGTVSWKTSILGVLPGMVLLGVSAMTKCIGRGDGMLLMILGLYLGVRSILLLFCVSIVLMGVYSGVLFLGKKVKGTDQIPYLPFLCLTYAGWYISRFVALST